MDGGEDTGVESVAVGYCRPWLILVERSVDQVGSGGGRSHLLVVSICSVEKDGITPAHIWSVLLLS